MRIPVKSLTFWIFVGLFAGTISGKIFGASIVHKQCLEIKKDSQFRYIKYYDARRSICKQCEAKERRKRRLQVKQHVKETGFTPGILNRLEEQAMQRAETKARKIVLDNLSQ